MLKFLKKMIQLNKKLLPTASAFFFLCTELLKKLDKHRYACFVKNTKNKKQLQLACLPPTSFSSILPSSSVAWLSSRPYRLGLEVGQQYIRASSNFTSTCAGKTAEHYFLQLQKGMQC